MPDILFLLACEGGGGGAELVFLTGAGDLLNLLVPVFGRGGAPPLLNLEFTGVLVGEGLLFAGPPGPGGLGKLFPT